MLGLSCNVLSTTRQVTSVSIIQNDSTKKLISPLLKFSGCRQSTYSILLFSFVFADQGDYQRDRRQPEQAAAEQHV